MCDLCVYVCTCLCVCKQLPHEKATVIQNVFVGHFVFDVFGEDVDILKLMGLVRIRALSQLVSMHLRTRRSRPTGWHAKN